MAGKGLDYWRAKWDAANDNPKLTCEYQKVLALLADYSGFYKSFVGFPTVSGGGTSRFLKGEWNHHHGSKVQRAIKSYFEVSGLCATVSEYQFTDVVLARVKEQIGNTPISPKGDLHQILEVIKEKTGTDYDAISGPSYGYVNSHERKPITLKPGF